MFKDPIPGLTGRTVRGKRSEKYVFPAVMDRLLFRAEFHNL
jgi:hypothetical protein